MGKIHVSWLYYDDIKIQDSFVYEHILMCPFLTLGFTLLPFGWTLPDACFWMKMNASIIIRLLSRQRVSHGAADAYHEWKSESAW